MSTSSAINEAVARGCGRGRRINEATSDDDMEALQRALERSRVAPRVDSRGHIELSLGPKPFALPSGHMVQFMELRPDGTWRLL